MRQDPANTLRVQGQRHPNLRRSYKLRRYGWCRAPLRHLNTDYLFWRPHKDANMEPLEKRQSTNQDATVIPIVFMGNLTMSNAARQGVAHA